MELNGQLNLLSTDATTGSAMVPLRLGTNAGYQFKTHPHIDKAKFNGEGKAYVAEADDGDSGFLHFFIHGRG